MRKIPRDVQRPSGLSVGELLARSYKQYALEPALRNDEEVLTYDSLGINVGKIAAQLRSLGTTPGERVVLVSKNSFSMLQLDQACFCSGFIRVALSPRLHPREVVGICNDCDAAVIAVDDEWAELLRNHVGGFLRRPTIIALDSGSEVVDIHLRELLHGPSSGEIPSPPTAGAPAAILYTSGTTGRPKGAVLSHRNWMAMIRNSMAELPAITPDDVVLHVAPLSHLSGYVAYTYFARGASHVVWPNFDATETLELIARHRITALPLVPTMLNMLVEEGEHVANVDVSSLRTIVYAGAFIAPDRLRRAIQLFGDVLVQFYGLSETPMPLTALSARDHQAAAAARNWRRLSSAGRVSPFVELTVVDDKGDEVATETVGEVVVRGDTVMIGYWDSADETAAMIAPDGWARTGDLGVFDAEGYLHLVDRKKDVIITGGYNVYAREVEDVILTLHEVSEVVVVGVPDDKWGETIRAVVVPCAGAIVDLEMIVKVCEQHLAAYKKPRSIAIVDTIPRTGSGKVRRRDVRAWYWPERTGTTQRPLSDAARD